MDNQTAKEILSAYRPGGEDATDPFFKDALSQCERDPGMRTWFEEQRAFDERIASALQSIRAPESGKRAILALAQVGEAKNTRSRSFWRRPSAWIAVAACLTVAFISLISVNSSPNEQKMAHAQDLTSMVASAMPLEFRHSDSNRVLNWLEERGAPISASLASKITAIPAAGCRIFEMPNGGKVSLICLQVDRELVHVFVYDNEAQKHFKGPINHWWQEDGYNLIATQKDEQLVAYATRADPDKVDYLL